MTLLKCVFAGESRAQVGKPETEGWEWSSDQSHHQTVQMTHCHGLFLDTSIYSVYSWCITLASLLLFRTNVNVFFPQAP